MRIVKLSEVLKHRKEFVQISDDQSYKLCRVQTNRKGVLLRELKIGALIRTKKQQVCKKDDFIVAEMDAKVGGYGFIPEDLEGSIVSSHYFLFDVDFGKIRKEYLEAIIQTEIIQEQIKAKGSTNYSAIRPKDVLNWEIPLATLEEQKEIEKNFLKIREASINLLAEIESQKSLLSHLKQSILQEAIQGKLTEAWRVLRQGQQPPLEPASELLKRIQAEKAHLIKEKKIKKEKPLPPITEEEKPFELPEGWEWCRLGEILLFSDSGKSPNCEKRPANTDEWGVLTTTAIQVGVFLEEANKVLPRTFRIDVSQKVEQNDVLITRAGPLNRTGVACKVKSIARHLILSDKTIRLKHPPGQIDPDFLVSALNSQLIRKLLIPKMTGMAESQVNISQPNIKQISFPVPPFEEQKAIVEKVESLMEKCRELEEEISQSEQHAQMLMQAVLKEAFES